MAQDTIGVLKILLPERERESSYKRKIIKNQKSVPILHTLGLIPPPCFIFEGCCFANGILYLLVRGFRHKI